MKGIAAVSVYQRFFACALFDSKHFNSINRLLLRQLKVIVKRNVGVRRKNFRINYNVQWKLEFYIVD